ncbi:filamentous hemagglutinin N-terminal domain-containing protein [Helicobacter pullorum]|uniref:filamentous hemagglutinin N-terminal domain-containing protein n=1 Tax=Helicobacter pullorum TaxID=35818 RepID=UPI003B007B5A
MQPKTISKIGISIIASVLLSQNLVAANLANNALPSGGKFTHGSGSIKVNGKEMNITGNNTNHIIAWGGGFNIGKDAEVKFNTSHGRQAAFLNLDYTNKASKILGKLNGNNHNIYLVNPSGVLIGKGASINANKFVASNTIDENTLNQFKNKSNIDSTAITSFSPVYKPNKGNVVNLGTINANHIVLIGNEVRNQAIIKENGKETIITGSFSGYDDKNPNSKIQNDSITLVGNIVDINIDTGMIDTKQVWIAAKDKARINQSTSDIYFNGNRLVGNNALKTSNDLNASNIEWIAYNGITNPKSIETYASIKDITDWYYFANGWNNIKNNMKDIQNFELINNIDFSKGNKICLKANCDTQNGIEGVDYFTFSGNYADPNEKKEEIEGISDKGIIKTPSFYGDSMIVGSGGYDGFSNSFVANFNGNGHTLSNIDIDMDEQYVARHMLGVFGVIGEIIGDHDRSVTIQNLIVDTININSNNRYMGNKSGSGIDGGTYAGGLVGYVGDMVANYPKLGLINFENIVVSNVEIVSKNGYSEVYLGGFAGNISAGSVSNIFVNNVKGIKATTYRNGSSWSVNLGGFAGRLHVVKDAKNIVLNGMGNITNDEYDFWDSMGGFVGRSEGNLSNIYVYFKPNSVFVVSNGPYARSDISIFGKFENSWTLDNVNLYYNFDTTNPNSIANLPHSEDYYNQTINPSIPAQDKINLYTYTNSTNKRDEFNTKIKQTFGDNIVILGNDIEGWNYHFNPPLNNPALPTLDMDNLFNKGGYFDSSSWLTKDDFNQSILDSILGKDNQGNSNLIFDLLTQDLESIRQSLDFLVSFLDGENDIKELFGDYYKVNDNIYGALNQDLTINLKFSNFIEALKQNKNINLAFLKDYRDKLNTYNQNKELYQSGGLPPLEQESLKKLLEEQYNELLNLEQIAKINLESLQGLIKDSFKMDTNYTIFAKESLSPLNFTINIGSLNNFEDTQGNGDNNNRFTPPSEVQKIADLASKEAILILPAQEKQEAIVEDGKERGRLCIVSDNAKTNNPCMAITY